MKRAGTQSARYSDCPISNVLKIRLHTVIVVEVVVVVSVVIAIAVGVAVPVVVVVSLCFQLQL